MRIIRRDEMRIIRLVACTGTRLQGPAPGRAARAHSGTFALIRNFESFAETQVVSDS